MNSLLSIRKASGKTQKEVADFLNVATSMYCRYEKGQIEMNYTTLKKLSDYFGVSVDAIMAEPDMSGVRQIVTVYQPELTEDVVMVPVVASLKCGYGYRGEHPYHVIKQLPIPAAYQRFGENLVVIIADGNSMLPTISPNSFLLCTPGEAWEDVNIVAVDINDSDTVKRIFHTSDGGIRLVPDNPHYQEQSFTPEEIDRLQIHVLGRIHKAISPDL